MNKLLRSIAHVIILPALLVCLLIPGWHDTTRAASPIYVDADAALGGDGSSWDEAYTDLQTALLVATTGGQIWVAEGVYKPGNLRTSTFTLMDGVDIYGGFDGTETVLDQRDWESNVTVLSGDVDNNDTTDAHGIVMTTTHIVGNNAYHVVFNTGVSTTTRLDGLTITGGKADGTGSHNIGGGMYSDPGDLRLVNVTFRGNSARGGGGIYSNGNPTLTDTTFSNNSANFGGGMYNNDNPKLSSVTFTGNSADYGGGMYNDDGDPTLTNVTFAGNSATGDGGGGGGMNSDGDPTLANVTFTGNSAKDRGGGMSNGGNPTLANVIFSGNSATWGGGMYNTYGDPSLANVTFSDNSADYGGGMYNSNSYPTLVNLVMWNNVAGTAGNQIHNDIGTPTISYSLIQHSGGSGSGWNPSLGTDGGGNIDADPLFIDADGPDNIGGTLDDNVRLQNTSPAIDAGDSTSVPADTGDLDDDGNTTEMLPYDLDNHRRFADMPVPDTGFGAVPIVDMGAYETNTAPIADAGAPQTVDPEATVTLNGSGSSDPDGHALAYQWTQSGGTPVVLSDDSAVMPTFTAPAAAGNLTFELTVTDAYGLSDSDTVTITVGAFYVYLPLVLR